MSSTEDTDEHIISVDTLATTHVFQIGIYDLAYESIDYLTQVLSDGGGVLKLSIAGHNAYMNL